MSRSCIVKTRVIACLIFQKIAVKFKPHPPVNVTSYMYMTLLLFSLPLSLSLSLSPVALYGGNGPWLHSLHLLSLPPPSLLPRLPSLINSLMSNPRSHSHVCREGVSTLMRVAPREVGGVIADTIVGVLQDEHILRTCEEDLEIAATPTSELWNPQLQQV